MGVRYKLSLLTLLVLTAAALGMTSVYASSEVYIEMNYEGRSFVYTDKYIEPTNHLVAEEIFERRINAPYAEKLDLIRRKIRGGADYRSALLTCFPHLRDVVDEVKAALDREPCDSQIKFDPNSRPMFTITRERSGVTVLEDRLYMDIYFALSASSKVKVNIPTSRPPASVKAQDNVALTKLRARYSTDISSSTSERKHNVGLALSKINGTSLQPGATFSFNEVVGRRTSKNGFLEAKIIKGGKYVSGVGGGVCQASTTLYNAALMSDLAIVSVSRHSLKSSYELPSFDAMVNSGSSDLKILNQGAGQVFIKAYATDERAYVEIYGSKLPYTIKRKSVVTFTGETPGYDEEVDVEYKHFEAGTESGTRKTISYSHPEVHSNGYLLYYDGYGRLIETKLIRTDVYNSVRGVIAIAP